MNPDEYQRMAAVEMQHWWYQGLRDALDRTLTQRRFAMPQSPSVLDAGCGTGGNLRFLQDRFRPAYLGGFDLSELAVQLSKQRVPQADVYQSDICKPELHVDSLDLIISCDVIYIPGAATALEGLSTLVQHLRPGGLLVLNLPAYNWLYSEHDVAIHTSERYTAKTVHQLLRDLGLTVQLVTYRLFLLFPAVVLARLPSLLRKKPRIEDAKSDLRIPAVLINSTLASILQCENSAIRHGTRFPWGSSVYAVATKA